MLFYIAKMSMKRVHFASLLADVITFEYVREPYDPTLADAIRERMNRERDIQKRIDASLCSDDDDDIVFSNESYEETDEETDDETDDETDEESDDESDDESDEETDDESDEETDDDYIVFM